MPHSVDEALRLDRENDNDLWTKAIEKEMKNVRVAFEFHPKGEIPVGHKPVGVHWVFDIKLGTLQRKARLVGNGNETEVPKEITFSSVVSRESVRLFFLIAALNDLEVLSADIQNAYINATTNERIYVKAVDAAFGSDAGRPRKIVRALYGLCSSGARFRSHLAAVLRDAGFVSSKADNDMWMRPATKADGTKYYEYVATYVDDILCCSMNPQKTMDRLAKSYTLKAESVKEPYLYLGADIHKHYISEAEDPEKTIDGRCPRQNIQNGLYLTWKSNSAR
eukprot:scaffold143909_cov63-Attheya_sp.AAC.1